MSPNDGARGNKLLSLWRTLPLLLRGIIDVGGVIPPLFCPIGVSTGVYLSLGITP